MPSGREIVAGRSNRRVDLLGYHALRKDVGLVGAKGFDPLKPTPQIVIPELMIRALRQTA